MINSIYMEIWKPVKGYEKYYEVSTFGNVKSLGRVVVSEERTSQIIKPRIIKPNVNSKQGKYKYNYVFLGSYIDKSIPRKNFKVHRLVAEHFLPNPENKPFINHKDNNGLNNSLSNLEWVTCKENNDYTRKQGRAYVFPVYKGKTHWRNKLKEKTI